MTRSHGVARLTLVTLVPVSILLILFASPLLHLWLGPSLQDQGVIAFRVLVAAVLLHAYATPALILIEAIGRSDIIARYYLIELFVYTPLAALAIWRFGVPGAAWIWLVRNIVFVSWARWYVRRHVHLEERVRVEAYANGD